LIEVDNSTDLSVPLKKITAIKEHLTDKSIELLILDSDSMREMNRGHRGVDKPTDVLSFPLSDEVDSLPLGTIIICDKFVKKGSNKFKHKKSEEFQLLFIHGLLHLLGFDHETDNGKMRKKEKKLIKKFNLPKSLIVRVEG